VLDSFRIFFQQNPVDLHGLPVDDAGHEQGQAAAGIALPFQIPAREYTLFAATHPPGQGMDLFFLVQAAPYSLPRRLVQKKMQDGLRLEYPPQLPLGPMEMILAGEGVKQLDFWFCHGKRKALKRLSFFL
jgi:hypothetical protein